MNQRSALLFILLGAMLWGTTGTAQSFAPHSAHPIAVGTVRLAVGGVTLFLFVWIKGKLQLNHVHHWPKLAIFFATVAMAAYQPLFFSGVAVTGVAVGTVVAIGSAPILTGLLEWFMYRTIPDRRWWLATLFAIMGCTLLVSTDKDVTISPLGIAMSLGAGFSFSLYTISSKNVLTRISSEIVVAVVFTCAALMLSPLLFVYDFSWLLQINGWLVALHLGVVATALAYLLFSFGLVGAPASTAVTLSLAEPLTASVLSIIIVKETLTVQIWIGLFCMFIALLFLSIRKKQ
ncbi:hypothetical protein J416_14021 [Gracilibacillus halophilus YIM-C55.5]|uniref:EamA domain-containing protein n=1 Tax=Gracilibacillus halophilus YIM-C55.5 TaxID=1308866 RepID=N4WMT9_9BACI|nr:EamA family transporter [Gracilibacillus halophilus]ENH95835.1 hypothetical protein J416_14021 [Gracilibacillus halophilus YIM-C55.5]